jgi:hypothetical protein
MSFLDFNSLDGEARVAGQEWHRLWGMLHDPTVGIVNVPSISGRERIEELTGTEAPEVAGPEDFPRYRRWIDSTEQRFTTGVPAPGITWQGCDLKKLGIVVNTALAVGGDPLKLAARLVAQADDHSWAEGVDRAWLAGIIDRSLKAGVLATRFLSYGDSGLWEPTGWENVTALLRARDDQPVVMSYSVSGSFGSMPDRWRPDLDGSDDREDQWGELGEAERWQACMDDLRARRPGARLDPATWDDVRFDDSVSALDLLSDDYMDRLTRAVGGGR